MSNLLINQGTNSAINFDLNGTVNTQVVGMGYGTLSTIGTLPNLPGGSIAVTSIPNISQGSIQVTNGTIGTVTGVGTLTNIGVVNNAGTLQAGTITTLPNIPGGTINILAGGTLGILTNGTLSSAGTVTGVGSVSNLGSMAMLTAGTISMLNAGTLTTIPNIPGGTINILAGGTLGILTNGTLSSSGTTTGVGSVSSLGSLGMLNAGTINMLNAGTLTTIPNIPGGTINILAGGTLGILTNGTLSSSGTTTGVGVVTTVTNLSNGTIQNSGTTTGIGTMTNLGTLNQLIPGTTANTLGKAGSVQSYASGDTGVLMLGQFNNNFNVNAGTNGQYTPLMTDQFGELFVNVGQGVMQINPVPHFNILTTGTAGTLGVGTLVAAPGVGTAIYVCSFSVDGDSSVLGTAEVILSFGTVVTGSGVLFRATLATLNDVANQSFPYPVNGGLTNTPLTYKIQSGAGTVSWNVSYFIQ